MSHSWENLERKIVRLSLITTPLQVGRRLLTTAHICMSLNRVVVKTSMELVVVLEVQNYSIYQKFHGIIEYFPA